MLGNGPGAAACAGVTGLLIAGVWASEAGWLGVKLSSKVFGCRLQV